MPQLKHFAPDTDPQVIAKAVEEDGAIVLDDVIDPAFIAALRSETDPYMEGTPDGFDDFAGRLTTRTGGLMARSEKCRTLIAHPVILDACKLFLQPYCQSVQLHLTQIIRIRPGQTAQMIHRDRWAWGTHLTHVEPQFNTIWAITDFTAENGATQVVPGSTELPDDAAIAPELITQAEMRAGSVLIYSGSVFHGGGENRSTSDRIGINITYTLGWLRQEENQYLSCPPEIAKTLDRPLQELIGYSMGQYALGYYTPPGAPGEHPEPAPPQYALGHKVDNAMLGSAADLDAIAGEVGRDMAD